MSDPSHSNRSEPGSDRPKLDAETMARLIDGTLSESERARALAVLASSDADLELLADAAVAAGEVSESVAPESPQDGWLPTEGRRGRRGWALWLPLAAAVAGLSLIPALLPDRSTDFRTDWARLVSVGTAAGEGAWSPDGPWQSPGWSSVRGDATLLDPPARAYRSGVLMAQLGAVLAAGDSTAASLVQTRLASLLTPVVGGALPVAELTAHRGDQEVDWTGPNGLDAWSDVAEDVASLLGEAEAFGLGLWVEGVRLAILLEQLDEEAPSSIRTALDEHVSRLRSSLRQQIAPVVADLTAVLESAAPDMSRLLSGLEALSASAGAPTADP